MAKTPQVLDYLSRHQPLTQREIATRFKEDVGTTHSRLNKLLGLGVVRKTFKPAGSGRKSRYVYTIKGKGLQSLITRRYGKEALKSMKP